MTAHNEKSIICNEPPVGTLHSGKTLTPPLVAAQDIQPESDWINRPDDLKSDKTDWPIDDISCSTPLASEMEEVP